MKFAMVLTALNLAVSSTILVGGIVAARKAKKKGDELDRKMADLEDKSKKVFSKVRAAFDVIDA